MKLLNLAPMGTLFFALTALDYPDIGDKVQWQGSIHLINGETTPVKISKEVTGYNSDSKKWTVKYVATVGKSVTTEFVEVDELYSPQKHQEMITSCTTQGGTIEKVSAPAGNYDTCKLRTTSAGLIVDKWYGDIPFGVVSRNTMDQEKGQELDLNSIVRGL